MRRHHTAADLIKALRDLSPNTVVLVAHGKPEDGCSEFNMYLCDVVDPIDGTTRHAVVFVGGDDTPYRSGPGEH